MFRDDDGDDLAKVSDFGYSTLFATEENLIFMPFSGPWTAPEYHHRGFQPSQAKKMDVYSFGMLAFWLLFYNTPEDTVLDFGHEIKKSSIKILDRALTLVENSQEIESRNKGFLKKFFEITLDDDPERRSSDFRLLGKLLFSK